MGSVVSWILWSGLLSGHDWILYSLVTETINQLPCSSTAGKAALKLVKLFACCLNSSQPTTQVPWLNRASGFALQTVGSVCPSLLNYHWPALLSGVFAGPSGQVVWKILYVGRSMFQHPFLGLRRGALQLTLSFPNKLSSWEGLWATLILGFELTHWLCVAQQVFRPCTGFALGAIYSAVLFLSSGTTGPHSFQDLSAVFWSDGFGRHLCRRQDGIQSLVWACANQALRLAKLLAWGSESDRSVSGQVPWSEGLPHPAWFHR